MVEEKIEKIEKKHKPKEKSDLEYLKLRLEKLRKHMSNNKQDKIMKRALSKIEARILQTDRRNKKKAK